MKPKQIFCMLQYISERSSESTTFATTEPVFIPRRANKIMFEKLIFIPEDAANCLDHLLVLKICELKTNIIIQSSSKSESLAESDVFFRKNFIQMLSNGKATVMLETKALLTTIASELKFTKVEIQVIKPIKSSLQENLYLSQLFSRHFQTKLGNEKLCVCSELLHETKLSMIIPNL